MAEKKDTAVAKKPENTAVGAVHDYGGYAGSGFEDTTAEDFAIPFLGLLQDMNDEVKKRHEKYIDGAEPGMFFNNVSQELFDGEAGVAFIPCCRVHNYIEWVPRDQGGGYVGGHAIDSDVVRKAKSEHAFGELKTDSGNDLIETFTVYGYMTDEGGTELNEPVVLSITKSKIAAWKKIMYRMKTIKGAPPMFANRLRLTAFPDKSNKGDFFNLRIEPLFDDLKGSLIDPKEHGDMLSILSDFAASVSSGERGADYSKAEGAEGSEDAPF